MRRHSSRPNPTTDTANSAKYRYARLPRCWSQMPAYTSASVRPAAVIMDHATTMTLTARHCVEELRDDVGRLARRTEQEQMPVVDDVQARLRHQLRLPV